MEKWKEVESFKFSNLEDSYGFETRLATEQKWSINFTEKAILEYKKFLYLASISTEMVSPSAIVDEVWHLHLIFTKSYKDFCNLLGKNIDHIPSTHNKNEEEKFKTALQHTKKIYEKHFKKWPKEIWEQNQFLEEIAESKWKFNKSALLLFTLAFVFLGINFFEDLIRWIQGSEFIFFYGFFSIGILILLKVLNAKYVNDTLISLNKIKITEKFHPFEWLAITNEKMDRIIHFIVNDLHKSNNLELDLFKMQIAFKRDENIDDRFSKQILEQTKEYEHISYLQLFKICRNLPIINQIIQTRDFFREKIRKSKIYTDFKIIKYFFYSIIFSLGLSRLYFGIQNNKNYSFLLFEIALITILLVVNNHKFDFYFFKNFSEILSKKMKTEKLAETNRQWEILSPTFVLTSEMAAFSSTINERNTQGSDSFGGCGSSCGSSCGGGGCGGGCGGCGS